jgi:hypothetical protein
VQRAISYLLPFLDGAAQTGKPCQNNVVVGNAGRGNLMPGRTPKQDRAPKLFACGNGGDIAITQALNIERHEWEIAQIAI